MSLCHLGHGNRLVCGCAHIIGHMKKMMTMLWEASELVPKEFKHLVSRKGSCPHIQIRKGLAKKRRKPVEHCVTRAESKSIFRRPVPKLTKYQGTEELENAL